MEHPEFFPGHEAHDEAPKKELTQQERTAKNERWSELYYKLKNENISDEERQKMEEEKEELRKQIT